MKKYILRLALLAVGMGAFVSCDEDTVTYNGKNFVSFDKVASTRFSFFEHNGVSDIPVNLAFPVSHDVTITFSAESDVAIAGTHYNLLTPNTITIPAGQTSANIRIEVIDNDIMNDSKSLDINLTGISDGNISLGMVDEASKFKRFLIVNDDCTTNFLEFVGRFDVKNTEGTLLGAAEAEVNETADCNVLRFTGMIDSEYGLDIDTYIEYTFIPGPNPTTGENVGSLSAFEQLYCEACLNYEGAAQNVLITGSGNFNVNQKRLTLNGNLKFQNGIAIGSSSVVLTPVQ